MSVVTGETYCVRTQYLIKHTMVIHLIFFFVVPCLLSFDFPDQYAGSGDHAFAYEYLCFFR